MRRALYAIVFLSIFASVLVGGHLYLARRLVLDPGLTEPWRSLLLGALVLLGASLILAPIAQRTLSPRAGRWIAWPASVWMGFAFLLLCTLWASEVVVWALGAPARAATSSGTHSAAAGRALSVVAVTGIVGLVALRGGLRPPRVRTVEHRLARWPRALDGLRIVQLSDLHIGPLRGRRFAQEVVERTNALEPDLVAVTGDLVDGDAHRIAGEVAPFIDLRSRHGVYFVTGNHDYYSGAEAWVATARDLGMRVLRNEHVTIEVRGGSFDLAGVEDHHARLVDPEQRSDARAALAGRDPRRPVVLLAHDPNTFRQAMHLGVDLQLSGHTHGGQIWPFRYFVRLATPFVAGSYRRSGARLYVSRGTGFWGPPMRLFSPAEITEHVLRSPDG